jgi:hypothetical protein
MEHPVPAERNFDEQPGPEEGKIRGVEFERLHSNPGETYAKTRQQCGEPVERREPHVYTIGLERNLIGRVSFRTVFCEREY